MKIIVLGAGGIIGQHMMLCKPDGVEASFFRRKPDLLFDGVDITDPIALHACLESHEPDVIVNLAGENSPDVVEKDPDRHGYANLNAALFIAHWCKTNAKHCLHVSSQAVLDPVNAYGRQKLAADKGVVMLGGNWTIARPTFVLGVRPLPNVGRPNPIEQMLNGQRKQVNDRWFSVSFARDVAQQLWRIAQGQALKRVVHIGEPIRTNRWLIATELGLDVQPVAHNWFPDIAARPFDTTYPLESLFDTEFRYGLKRCKQEFESRKALDTIARAAEVALFMGIPENQAIVKLRRGFGALHADVATDFRATNQKTDAELLEWYRSTEAYIWELSAYHADAGFNYSGMCQGVTERLKAAGAHRVLCLGDGIGDLTLALLRAGFEAVYHDLDGSRTAQFARFRFWMYNGMPGGNIQCVETSGWGTLPILESVIVNGSEPVGSEDKPYDAVISFDFLEHVTDVPLWTKTIRSVLKPGGLFFAQNAFACGSGPDGSIPMHLARNDRFEKDWDPHLASLGFVQESSNWYRKTDGFSCPKEAIGRLECSAS